MTLVIIGVGIIVGLFVLILVAAVVLPFLLQRIDAPDTVGDLQRSNDSQIRQQIEPVSDAFRQLAYVKEAATEIYATPDSSVQVVASAAVTDEDFPIEQVISSVKGGATQSMSPGGSPIFVTQAGGGVISTMECALISPQAVACIWVGDRSFGSTAIISRNGMDLATGAQRSKDVINAMVKRR
ncbi:MAG: hypothetical protein ACRCTR_08510 [Actinomycetota bacterium]